MMQVLRLQFHDSEDPLDVKTEDVVDISSSSFDDMVAVEVRLKRRNNPTYLPKSVKPVERKQDSEIDLH